MRILADENITAVREHFASHGEVLTVPGRSIDAAMVRDCDALLVRSVTRVTPDLLNGSRCRFVASATSGTDHLDLDGLARAGITATWAAGCNAVSVVDYVFSALAALTPVAGRHWRECRVGVIGCGIIGSTLVQRLLRLGMAVKIHDPLLPYSHPLSAHFVTLEEVLQQQVITLHVPLTRDGAHPTRHMLSKTRLELIPPDSVLINAARGAAIDNQALLDWLQRRPAQRVVLDTWENEPAIALELLRCVTLGTPHIAGYSAEGKLNGTRLILDQFCRHFGLDAGPTSDNKAKEATLNGKHLDDLILASYDVRDDHRDMQALLASPEPGKAFDQLRKHYPERHEFSHFRIAGTLSAQTAHDAAVLGFRS